MGESGILSAIRTTLSGLSVQMKKMEVTSENIANVEKSPDENGKVYQKKIVSFNKSAKSDRPKFSDTLNLKLRRTKSEHIQPGQKSGSISHEKEQFKVEEQKGERLVFNPNHPQADEQGYVRMPDINMIEEMVNLISATRSYEANVTAINAAKQMAKKSLEI